MEIIKEEIGEYIFYILPEERGESFYIKKRNYSDLMYLFGIIKELNYTKEQLLETLHKDYTEYIKLYKRDYEEEY